jgi:hypothetical protein
MMEECLKERSIRRISHPMPMPMTGKTSERLKNIFETGREDLSLAKICEAHWDALGILHESKRTLSPHHLYGVWASEIPGNSLQIVSLDNKLSVNGTKMFATGAGIIDSTIVTAEFNGENVMIELNFKDREQYFKIVNDKWFTKAFSDTNTSTVIFQNFPIKSSAIFGSNNWYVKRKGFWMGALGPAACWGGGAAGLLDYAMTCKRRDPHTVAHLAAISANIFAIESVLDICGKTIDEGLLSENELQILALKTRHIVELNCTDVLRRFARAYGPYPIACIENVCTRYQELDLYLRQNHAERDLESLGKVILSLHE